ATDNLEGDDSRVIMDRAIDFVRRSHKKKRPFFMVVWFHAPHWPVVASEKYSATYASHGDFAKNYYGCIAALDNEIGRLRATLKELKVEGDTMVWFSSDNGPEGSPKTGVGRTNGLRGRKRSLYEGGVRVPGLLVWPRGAGVTPRRLSTPCSTSDYLPTIVEALGLERSTDHPLDGTSLLPLISKKHWTRDAPIGFHSGRRGSVVRSEYKLVRDNKNKDWELYNLSSDPSESKNLATEKPKLVAELKSWYRRWRASCQASAEGKDYGSP
ncbi:MAG: sulfatase-like hydrolase/transferase, partial [Planctomycetota bacterium]